MIKYGRDDKKSERLKSVGIQVPYELYATVKQYAKAKNVSMSYVIRRCIELVLEEED